MFAHRSYSCHEVCSNYVLILCLLLFPYFLEQVDIEIKELALSLSSSFLILHKWNGWNHYWCSDETIIKGAGFLQPYIFQCNKQIT